MSVDKAPERGAHICAVIVTYNPQPAVIEQLLHVCMPQVSELVVVDNGTNRNGLESIRQLASHMKFVLIELGENLGVAAAQNKGIAWARERLHSFVLMLDQDSIPAADMVDLLLHALGCMESKGVQVAGVGPRLIDRRTGRHTPFVRINFYGITRKRCQDGLSQVVPADFLVSSGMLLPLKVLDVIGLPEEALFIDNVDMEWCFRARSKGYSLYGVCDALMLHSVGDQVFTAGPMVMHRHGPLRQYYIMRNRLVLYRRTYAPAAWILQDALRALFKLFVFSVCLSPRKENIRMMYRGIKDGLSGRLGKYSD